MEDLKPFLTGQRFNRLTIIKEIDKKKVLCRCSCGKEKIIIKSHVFSGHTKSCGCFRKETATIQGNKSVTHGETETRLFNIWNSMRKRCFKEYSTEYRYYGGRGIKVCEDWKDYINFRNDMFSPYFNHCQKYGEKNTTIDREDVNGNYCKENCRWSTYKEQANNRRSNVFIEYKGEKHTIAEWAEKINIRQDTLSGRIKRNWNIERALKPNL